MKNEYWIFVKSKSHLDLIIDIYDPDYMELSREVRFSELKSLLLKDIMSVKSVHIQWELGGFILHFKESQTSIERIVKVHELLESAYKWLDPWYDKNTVLEDGSLILDESMDNSHLKHYKKANKQNKQTKKGKYGR